MDIVLTTSQKNALLQMKAGLPQLFKSHSTFEPIEIETKDANGDPYYIIPYSLLENPDFAAFKKYVFDNLTSTIEIRIVEPNEFKVYEDI